MNIAGKEYPVHFGTLTLVSFEENTGVSISEIGKGTSYSNVLHLIYEGMKSGARREKAAFDHSFEEFCDLIDTDAEAIEKMMAVFESSMPQGDDGEKKVKAKRKVKA